MMKVSNGSVDTVIKNVFHYNFIDHNDFLMREFRV